MPSELELALFEINKFRMKHGRDTLDEMPKGELCRNTDCPVANALQGVFNFGVAGSQAAYTIHGNKLWTYPKVVADFIEHFDNGDYPELIYGSEWD